MCLLHPVTLVQSVCKLLNSTSQKGKVRDRVCAHCGPGRIIIVVYVVVCFNKLLKCRTFEGAGNISNVDKAEYTTTACANQVLMQTATMTVKNPQDSSTVSVCLTLDSESQQSYITEKLAKGLKLTQRNSQLLPLVQINRRR